MNASPVTQSALDFEGLAKLRSQAHQDEKKAVRETAQQFEAMFIQQMMKTMRDTIEKSELTESNAQETFESMFDREVAHQMSQRNSLGLADMLVKDHDRRSQMMSTADALQSRELSTAPPVRALNPAVTGMPLPQGLPSGIALPAPAPLKALPGLGMPLSNLPGTGIATDKP